MPYLDGYLAADGINLTADVLDCIDRIVRPGQTVNISDNCWEFGTRSLEPAFRRR